MFFVQALHYWLKDRLITNKNFLNFFQKVGIFSLQCDLHNLPTLHVLRKVDKCLEPDMTTQMSHLKHKVITK